MQRWFYADSFEECEIHEADEESSPPEEENPKLAEAPDVEYDRCWKFCASIYEQLHPNEYLAVTGNCEALGNWQFSRCVIMTCCSGCPTMWKSISMLIPRYKPTEYRYLVVAHDYNGNKYIVRRWESSVRPRVLLPQKLSTPVDRPDCEDVFAMCEDTLKVDHGWLTCQTFVQFTFAKALFTWKSYINQRLQYVKVTPMKISEPADCFMDTLVGKPILNSPVLDNLSIYEARRESDAGLSTAFALSEVAVLKYGRTELHAQPQWGVAANYEDIVLFHLTIGDLEQTTYRIDLYTYSDKAAADEPPYHFGYCNVLPQQLLKQSCGNLKVSINCASKHRPLGVMQFGYLIIRPITPPLEPALNMRTSFMRHWKPERRGMEVGHRGCGLTYVDYEGVIRENTLHSLQRAAAAGANMVDFDVHVSRDHVPFLYHDYNLFLTSDRNESSFKHDFSSFPISEFSMAELELLRVAAVGEGYYWQHECPLVGEERAQQPFPTLEQTFEQIDPNVGFFIEVKWPQLLKNNTMEQKFKNRMDRNVYVDAILEVVFRKAQSRFIVLSCFDVDICSMLRFKQNLYPVMLLTLGNMPSDHLRYADLRCQTFDTAIYTAQVYGLLGLVTPSHEIVEDPAQMLRIRQADLVLFGWGSANKTTDIIQMQSDLGVAAIIYDRIDKLTCKDRMQCTHSGTESEIRPQTKSEEPN